MEKDYIVAIGVACVDEYYTMDHWIPEGEKGNVCFVESRIGGMIPNATCVLAGYGEKTYMITALNNQEVSKAVRSDLEKWNLDLSCAVIDKRFPDAKCMIIKTPAERTIFVSDTSTIRYPVDKKRYKLLKEAKCIYTSMMEFHRLENWEELAKDLAESGVKIVFDLETSTFDTYQDPLFDYASILIFNEEGWKKFCGKRQEKECLDSLLKGRTEVVMITLGAEGCYGRTKTEEIRIPGNKVAVVDTTGAGDTFNGSFVFSWLSGKTLKYCAEFANAAGAYAVTVQGARGGIASYEETEKRMKEFSKERQL